MTKIAIAMVMGALFLGSPALACKDGKGHKADAAGKTEPQKNQKAEKKT